MENEAQQKTPILETSKEARATKMITINVKTVLIIGAVVVVVAILFFAKGMFVVAMVDGSPISRLSVIRELEKQGGKLALDALITEKLIQNEASERKVAVTDAELDEEMNKIEAQLAAQGGTLPDALAQQGMTEESLKEQVRIQQLIQKLLADKVTVTEEEVQAYIADNEITLPKGEEQAAKDQITDQLRDQKLGEEAQVLIANLRNDANIQYFVKY